MKALTIKIPYGYINRIDGLASISMEGMLFLSRSHFLISFFLHLESMVINNKLWEAIRSTKIEKTKNQYDILRITIPDGGKERLDQLLAHLKTMGFKSKGELIAKSVEYFTPYKYDLDFWNDVATQDRSLKELIEHGDENDDEISSAKIFSTFKDTPTTKTNPARPQKPVTQIVRL